MGRQLQQRAEGQAEMKPKLFLRRIKQTTQSVFTSGNRDFLCFEHSELCALCVSVYFPTISIILKLLLASKVLVPFTSESF